MPKFNKSNLRKPFWFTLVLSGVTGYAQVSDKLPLALLSLGLLFLIFLNSFNHSLRKRLFTIGSAFTVYMMSVTIWFKNIDALGWQDIAGLPPQFWLMLAVFITSILCAFSGSALFLLAYKLSEIPKVLKQPLLIAYIWAISITGVELMLSYSFSVITAAEGASFAPTWNMYAIGLLTATNFLGGLAKFTGLWGASFVLYMLAALIALLLRDSFNRKQFPRMQYIAPAFLFTVVVTGLSLFELPPKPGHDMRVFAVSEPSSDSAYLEKLQPELYKDLEKHTGKPTVVILPEYSNLISPYGNSSILTFNYDARYTYPEVFKNKDVYFIGTEDQFHQGKRYPETYMVNNQLEKIKVLPKTFLIPGGEYVIGWVKGLISIFNKDSAALLADTRTRQVIRDVPHTSITNDTASHVAIRACSSVLAPYSFRQEAKTTGMFAVNVSYEQFSKAREYKQFANRFARLTAQATSRPLAIGAFGGSAVIYDSKGRIIESSNPKNNYAAADITTESSLTPYVILGDFTILVLLALPALLLSGYLFYMLTQRKMRKYRK